MPVLGDIPKRARSNVDSWRETRNAVDVLNQRIDEIIAAGPITVDPAVDPDAAVTTDSLGAEKFVFCPSACTVTLPPVDENIGRIYHIIRSGNPGGSNNVTIEAVGDDLINGDPSVVINQQNGSISLVGINDEWRIF
jgi:hypothetical protein